MVLLGSIGLLILLVILLIAAGVTPRQPVLSAYELQRRKKDGSTSADDELRRLSGAKDIAALLRVIEATAIVLIAALSVGVWGVLGVVLAVVVTIFYRRVASIEAFHHSSQRLYDEFDTKLVNLIEKYPRIGKILGGIANDEAQPSFGSKQELEHMIEESSTILTTDEKRLLKSNLQFADILVESVMTPRGVIETVDAREVLGPIVLDQLHKTGHSRFPVKAEDIDHIVGVLHIRDLLSLQEKSSQTAEQAMEKKVYYIHQSQTLHHALAAFLSTRHHLFIVVNEYRETAGIITLEDCIEALIGRKIVDEFDRHDDLRVVAARNAQHNNNPPHATNV